MSCAIWALFGILKWRWASIRNVLAGAGIGISPGFLYKHFRLVQCVDESITHTRKFCMGSGVSLLVKSVVTQGSFCEHYRLLFKRLAGRDKQMQLLRGTI